MTIAKNLLYRWIRRGKQQVLLHKIFHSGRSLSIVTEGTFTIIWPVLVTEKDLIQNVRNK